MANKTSYLKLDKPLLTEAADIDVLNNNFDKIDAEFVKVNGSLKKNVIYISESQNWTVPTNVYKIDLFIIDGGYDGETGVKATSSGAQYAGGAGGKGGACLYCADVSVTPGTVYSVVVGASNGGQSSFGAMKTFGLAGSAGGSGNSEKNNVNESNLALKKGALGIINGICSGFCPIDGKYYGVSGAGGAMVGTASTKNGSIVSDGGTAGKYNADHLPTGGVRDIDWSDTSYTRAGGGGASYDNDGQANVSDYTAGAGGNATTYGCGGGGGGATPYNTLSVAGAGGTGAYGAVIIAY